MNFVKRVLKVEPYQLTIEFKNGEIKIVDLEDRIRAKSTTPASKYRALLDFDYFKKVKSARNIKLIFNITLLNCHINYGYFFTE